MADRIWYRDYTLEEVRARMSCNMIVHLGIELTDLGPDFLAGTMPVDTRTTQPANLLHGGASVTLAETLGSIAANLCIDPSNKVCVGQEISASHLRPVQTGQQVTGLARPLYRGQTTQVWDIAITDQKRRLVCVSRLSVAVVASGHGGGKAIVLPTPS